MTCGCAKRREALKTMLKTIKASVVRKPKPTGISSNIRVRDAAEFRERQGR